MEIFYLASGFAFLAFYEKPVSSRASETKAVFFSLIRQSVEIFTPVFLFAALGRFLGEALILFLVAASYAIARVLKKENAFFLTVLAFGFFVSNPQVPAGFSGQIRRLFLSALLFTLTRFVLEGLGFRLLFAAPPKRLSGIPVLIFAFSIFLMALSAFTGVVE